MKPDIMFYAFRYALGRTTYAVSDVSQYLIDHWDEIDAKHQRLIHTEISEALTNGTAGHECDKKCWHAVLAVPVSSTTPAPPPVSKTAEELMAEAMMYEIREEGRGSAILKAALDAHAIRAGELVREAAADSLSKVNWAVDAIRALNVADIVKEA